MFENIKERYQKGYIRDDQLARFVKLDVITQAQADTLIAVKGGESSAEGDVEKEQEEITLEEITV